MKETIFQMKTISDAIPQALQLRFAMCGTTYPNRSYHIYRPNSMYCCLEYIVKGSGTVNVNGQTFHPKAGDTYLLLQGKDQNYFSNKKDPWEKIWVNFSGDYALSLASLLGIGERSYFPSLDTSDLLLKLQTVAQYPDREDAAENCAAILSRLFFRLAEAQTPVSEKTHTAVGQMLLYIEQHETERISVEQLAQVCQKSPSQAERLFAAEVGMPIYRYILTRKLELAKQLLRETGMTVREISSFLSFEDEFYFSGLFRKKTGYSPSQYRKESRGHTDRAPSASD